MNKITLDGQMDRVFADDRDVRIEGMSVKERVPSYGSNSLHRPSRPLGADEAEQLNSIGTSPPPDKKA